MPKHVKDVLNIRPPEEASRWSCSLSASALQHEPNDPSICQLQARQTRKEETVLDGQFWPGCDGNTYLRRSASARPTPDPVVGSGA